MSCMPIHFHALFLVPNVNALLAKQDTPLSSRPFFVLLCPALRGRAGLICLKMTPPCTRAPVSGFCRLAQVVMKAAVAVVNASTLPRHPPGGKDCGTLLRRKSLGPNTAFHKE